MTQVGAIPRVVFLDRDTLSPETRLRDLCISASYGSVRENRSRPRSPSVSRMPRLSSPTRRPSGVKRSRARPISGSSRLPQRAPMSSMCKACAERGVTVSNIRNYAVNTVPEHTFALIFALRRSIVAYRDAVLQGRWQEAGQFCFFDFPIRDLAGSTLGIIGDGALGRAVADLGRAFGMRILFSAYKGVQRDGAALHTLRRGHADQRRHYASLPVDGLDQQHDLRSRVCSDGAPAAAHQHGARWVGR